jgi:hypothetical protein
LCVIIEHLRRQSEYHCSNRNIDSRYFRVNSIDQFNNVIVTTNENGEFTGGLPDFGTRNVSAAQASRQLFQN